MDADKLSSGTCPISRGLARVGDVWSMLILRDASLGLTRFEQFRTSLGVAPNILTRRLKALTEGGLLEKVRYSTHPPRDEYRLTEAGRDFLPVLQVIAAWGRKHNGAGKVSDLIDVETGEPIAPVVIDSKTNAPLGSRALRLVMPEN
jgi:DNA-binding HxlR family transcriptional regulator